MRDAGARCLAPLAATPASACALPAARRFEFRQEEARYAFRLVDYGQRKLQVGTALSALLLPACPCQPSSNDDQRSPTAGVLLPSIAIEPSCGAWTSLPAVDAPGGPARACREVPTHPRSRSPLRSPAARRLARA